MRSAVAAAYGWDLEAPVPDMVLTQIDQVVIRQINDFEPDGERPFILDCGANIGISALHYRKQYPGARIVAFEPDPALFATLRRNLERNSAGEVEAVEAAVWTHRGEMPFASDGADGGRVETDSTGVGLTTVHTVDLNDYLQEPVDLLKLDIEGAEYQVVSHVASRLCNVKNIIVECHISQSAIPSFGLLLQQLSDAEFQVTFDTFGNWRDLIRGQTVDRFHFEQYVAVYGSRSASGRSAQGSCLPYLDASVLMEFHRALGRRHRAAHRLRLKKSVLAKAATAIPLQGPFEHDGGLSWRSPLPSDLPQGDTIAAPTSSLLVLYENGAPIGPAHSEHELIRKYGGGRFSHWDTMLYFSTSDDTDPNTNARTYSVALDEPH